MTLTSQSLLLIVLLLLGSLLWWLIRACDRANGADWGGRWLNRLDGLNRLFCRRFHRLHGALDALPQTGPALLVSNHISGLDPLLLIAASPRPLRFIIAAEQYHRFGLQWLFRAVGCIPVDRRGRPERAFREALRAVAEGEVVALFPHGRIHLDEESPRPLKAGVAKLSQLASCPVYPVRIDGVTGQGQVVSAVFRRSRARLTDFAPVHCEAQAQVECLSAIAKRIEAPAGR